MDNRILVALLMVGSFTGGVLYERERQYGSNALAIARIQKENNDRNEEVVNGWAHAVDHLWARIRNGDAPKIPLPSTPGESSTSGSPPGTSPPGVSTSRELANCRAERKQLIEDGARTMIDCRALQEWARKLKPRE